MAVEVAGARELARLLRELGDKDLQKANRIALKTAADVVAAEARQRAPVQTGRLQRSIRATANQKSGSVKVGGGRVPYGNTIVWGRKAGNVGSPPGNHKGRNPVAGRPFPQDALDAKREEVVDIYRREVEQVFDAARKRFD
jgi:HK97 gp10 family phage protein